MKSSNTPSQKLFGRLSGFLLKLVPIALAAFVLAVRAPQARAEFTFTLQQVGSDVVLTGSGTLNTTSFTESFNTNGGAFLSGPEAAVGGGPTDSPPITEFYPITGPTSFGTGGADASSGSGDYVGLEGDLGGSLWVPYGYVSGAALSDTDTWSDTTLSGLGVTPGTYTWSWGSGPSADSLTLEVPEPSSGALVLLALGGIFYLRPRTLRS